MEGHVGLIPNPFRVLRRSDSYSNCWNNGDQGEQLKSPSTRTGPCRGLSVLPEQVFALFTTGASQRNCLARSCRQAAEMGAGT